MARRFPWRSPWLWLALGLTVALVLTLRYATSAISYFIQPDELTYVRGAVFISEHHRPLVQGDFWFNSYAQLWPLLLSFFYGPLNSIAAFDVAHWLQGIAFTATGIPTFLLARRVTPSGAAAVLAALLTVAVPWVAVTLTLMSEPLAYFCFAWALLLMHVGLTRRGAGGDLLALAGVGLAFVSRTQFAILGPSLLAVVVLHELGWGLRGERAGLKRSARAVVTGHPLLLAVLVLGGLAVATGVVGKSVLGSYYVTVERSLLPAGTFRNTQDLTAIATVAVGVITPALAAAWTLLTLWRPATREAHVFASLAAVLCVVIPITSGAFVINVGAQINDRYVMYLVPILFIGAMSLLADRRPAPVAILLGGAIGAVAMASNVIYETALSMPSPTRTTHAVWDGRMQQIGHKLGIDALHAGTGLAIFIALFAIAFALVRRRGLSTTLQIGVLGGALLALAVAQSAYTTKKFRATQVGASQEFLDQRNWVDDTLGSRKVTALHGRILTATTGIWWETLTFNKQVSEIATRKGDEPYLQTFLGAFTIDDRGRFHGIEEHPYVLTSATERRFALRGARQLKEVNALRLYRVPVPYQAEWDLDVTDSEGHLRAGDGGFLRFHGNGRVRRGFVVLKSTLAPYARDPYVLRVEAGGRAVAKPNRFAKPVTFRLPVTIPASGAVRVDLHTVGRAPADKNADDGVQITDVAFVPARRR